MASKPASKGKPKDRGILLPYQQRWVNDRANLKIWLAARQIGKSFAISMEAVDEALRARCNNLILSSSERQSREVMQKVYQHLRVLRALSGDALRAARENRGEVELSNGSRIISLPASPDTVRGFSGNVFLDEFAFHRDSREIWRAMYPTVTRGYRVRITSTPNGRQNMFHDIWAHNEGFSRHRTDIHEAARDGLKVDIEELRKGVGDPDSWAQEFECAFIDEATAYITYEMIAACEDEGATMDFTPTPALPPQGGGSKFVSSPPAGEAWGRNKSVSPPLVGGVRGGGTELFLGVDIGRHKDLTVLWLLEKVGDVLWSRMVRVLLKEPFSVQRDFLYSLLDGSFLGGASIRRACIDSSGPGMQLAEEAVERFGSRVEPVTFTAPVKEDLAVTLRRRFEDRQLRIPPDRDVREDIHSVRKVSTAAGNVRFDAERSDRLGHADRFWALALAAHAASAPSGAMRYETVAGREAAFRGAGAW